MLSNETLKRLQLEQKKLDEFIWENYQKRNNITSSNNIGKTKESFIRSKIALFVEIGELANELKTFKHWKSQKDINLDKAKEELIDCLHFYLGWANSFEVDFSNYKFQKLAPEPNYNELLLAFFSETESFSIEVPWNEIKRSSLANFEKHFENYSGDLEEKQKAELLLKTKNDLEKVGNDFLSKVKEDKNRESFYRWLIIFEEIAKKMGMDEKDIEKEYMAKNKINWERQRQKY